MRVDPPLAGHSGGPTLLIPLSSLLHLTTCPVFTYQFYHPPSPVLCDAGQRGKASPSASIGTSIVGYGIKAPM